MNHAFTPEYLIYPVPRAHTYTCAYNVLRREIIFRLIRMLKRHKMHISYGRQTPFYSLTSKCIIGIRSVAVLNLHRSLQAKGSSQTFQLRRHFLQNYVPYNKNLVSRRCTKVCRSYEGLFGCV